MNKVFLAGNLGNDAEVKHTTGGQMIISFSLATTSKWNDKNTGKLQERTEWHRCSAWGERWKNVAPYLTKGSKIAVIGDVRYRQADKDGVKVTYTDINVDEIELLSSKKDGEQRQAKQQALDVDDDLPFG
jgi:single-strand DNA-binding protein